MNIEVKITDIDIKNSHVKVIMKIKLKKNYDQVFVCSASFQSPETFKMDREIKALYRIGHDILHPSHYTHKHK